MIKYGFYRVVCLLGMIVIIFYSCNRKMWLLDSYVFVDNSKDLISALASPMYTEIEIDSNSVIDLTGMEEIELNGGIRLFSGEKKKALIFTNKLRTLPLFVTKGDNIKIEGIHFKGPDSRKRTKQMKSLYKKNKYYSIPNSQGIRILNQNVEISNCEISGWSYAGIFVGKDAKASIINNNIFENQREGLGYGICVSEGEAFIKGNIFKNNRHHIAGSGKPGSAYEACYNNVYESSSHAFDMHGGRDRKDGTNIAGDYVKIHNNTFYYNTHPAVMIGGKTIYDSRIENNVFMSDSIQKQIIILDK